MKETILFLGIVLLICVLIYRWTEKLPIPSLLVFLLLGMVFGENGLFRISFDNYEIADIVCSTCLIFIIYYGGFGVNLKEAKNVIMPSLLLSTVGVFITAILLGVLVHFILKISMLESLLIGSVIASTDAASVFNILKSSKLSLKYNSDSLLEMESGSNDPISYMLTVVMCALLLKENVFIPVLLLQQLAIGVLAGIIFGRIAVYILNNLETELEQASTILVVAMMLISFALPTMFNGNGYISVYICGIVMGNASIKDKKSLVHVFDTLTGICQMMIFFLLGLLVTPSNLPGVFIPSLVVMALLTFVARPLSVFTILTPFKAKLSQILLVSWAGLRGVASIVFSIYVVVKGVPLSFDIFNMVFCIVLLSITFQGSGLPWMAKITNMIDENKDILRTFNDYQENSSVNFLKAHIDEGHYWENRQLKDLALPNDLVVALVIRNKDELITPKGDTTFQKGDLIVLAGKEFDDRRNLMLLEKIIEKKHKWIGLPLSQIKMKNKELIVMIQRNDKTIIPSGDTVIEEEDVLVIAHF